MSKASIYPDQRFQDSVLETDLMYATATSGAPSAGQFYSTIVGRAPIVDLRKDLKSRMGIERIITLGVVEIQNEFGPNGERVFGAINDDRGLIRYTGNPATTITADGVRSRIDTPDVVEIVFHGTGLNVLLEPYSGFSGLYVKIDSENESANLLSGSYSSCIATRGYGTNQVVNVASLLPLGVHTAKIRTGAAVSFYGVEVLNESASIITNPGSAVVAGSKRSLVTQDATAYNTFESGTSNGRGGRVIKYLKKDGTIGAILNPVPTLASAQAYAGTGYSGGQADHSNEEVIRTHYWREFGANRADDFSTMAGSGATTRAFTLDDGTTTLIGYNVSINTEGIGAGTGATDFLTFTFVGTGLDVVNVRGATHAASVSIIIDGVTIITSSSCFGSGLNNQTKVVSGLPYGTHTFKLLMNAGGVLPYFSKFIVYGPKKPAIPTGAIEVGDTFLMADYSPATSGTIGYVPQGVLRKFLSVREGVYSSAVAMAGIDVIQFESGFNLQTNTATNYFTYTFFGTGVEYATFVQSSQARNHTFSIDGSTNLSTSNTSWPNIVTALIGTNLGTIAFTGSTGVMSGTSAAGVGRLRLRISGLPLGMHTIKVLYNSGDCVYPDIIDVITPIYSHKSNVYTDLQNTLTVGSNSIGDSRKTTPIALPAQQKSWAQAIQITSTPTTSSVSYIPCPDMSLVIKTSGGPLEIGYSTISNNTSVTPNWFQIYVDGVAVSHARYCTIPSASQYVEISDSVFFAVSPGFHKIDLYWCVSAGTATIYNRILKAREI